MDLNQKHPKIFYGWYIVGASGLIAIYAHGVIGFGFTAVFEPIAEEFGWSYAQISLAASLRGFEVGLLAPLIGLLVDRWGPRRLIFGGGIIICGGLLLLSQVSSLAMFYGAFAAIALGMSTTTSTVLMTTVIKWFRRKAGVAIGIVSAGMGLGGLMVPIVTKLIEVLQWRTAMVTFGLGMLVIILPLSLLFRHKPDGEVGSIAKTMEAQVSTAGEEVNIPAKQAIRNRAFWHISISSMFHTFVVGALFPHIMPYLSSLDIARSVSSMIVLFISLVSIGSRLSSGWLADRFGSKQVSIAAFFLITAGLLLFGYVTTERIWLLVPFIITFSLGWGFNVTARVSLLRDYFGSGSFGTIFGFLSGIMMLGNITGAPLAGWVFDTWGSYQGAWLGYGALTLVGAVLVFTIPSSSNSIPQPDQLGTHRITK